MDKAPKKTRIPIPVIVAIIGLIGTIIVAIPSFLDSDQNLKVSDNTQISYVRYDDPSGSFSIEYPSENGIDSRKIFDNYFGLEILPRNKLSIFNYYFTPTKTASLSVVCGVSKRNLNNEEVMALVEDVMGLINERDLILISNSIIDNGYYVQYESKNLISKNYSHVFYQQEGGAYILVYVRVDKDYELSRTIGEHIFLSLQWHPSVVVDFINNQ